MTKTERPKIGLIRRFQLPCVNADHHYETWIYRTLEELQAAVRYLRYNGDDDHEDTYGLHVCAPITEVIDDEGETVEIRIPKRLGRIFLSLEQSDIEIITHEVQHAITNRIRVLNAPTPEDLIEQTEYDQWPFNAEEVIALEVGRWNRKIYEEIDRLLEKEELL